MAPVAPDMTDYPELKTEDRMAQNQLSDSNLRKVRAPFCRHAL